MQDFAGDVLAGVLTRIDRLGTAIDLTVRVATSREIRDAVRRGRLDAGLHAVGDDDPEALRHLDMVWLGRPTTARRSPLPLAMIEAPCPFRTAAENALQRAGIPYRITLETPSLEGLAAAVASGLAITCRTTGFAASGFPPLKAGQGLPQLGTVGYTISSRRTLSASQALIKRVLAEALEASANSRSRRRLKPA